MGFFLMLSRKPLVLLAVLGIFIFLFMNPLSAVIALPQQDSSILGKTLIPSDGPAVAACNPSGDGYDCTFTGYMQEQVFRICIKSPIAISPTSTYASLTMNSVTGYSEPTEMVVSRTSRIVTLPGDGSYLLCLNKIDDKFDFPTEIKVVGSAKLRASPFVVASSPIGTTSTTQTTTTVTGAI